MLVWRLEPRPGGVCVAKRAFRLRTNTGTMGSGPRLFHRRTGALSPQNQHNWTSEFQAASVATVVQGSFFATGERNVDGKVCAIDEVR